VWARPHGRTENKVTTSHQDDELKSSRVTLTGGNVFADLGLSAKEAKNLLVDADIYIAKAPSYQLGRQTGL